MPPVDLSTFTDEQKQLFNRANALGTGVQTIDSSNIAPSQGELNIPTFQQQSPQELQSAIKSIPEIVTEFNRETPVETTQNQIVSELLSTLRETQGREQAQFQAEQDAGIPEQTKRLQELSGRLTQLQNEALATPLQIQEEFKGRGATAGGVEPIQTARLRQNAIQSLTIGAQAQALQGNIALARQQVNRAVDLEFKPIEDRLQFLKTAYTLNKDTLDRLDKKRSEQLQINLRERERQLADMKENRQNVSALVLKGSQLGLSESVLEKANQADTYDDALSILAGPISAAAQRGIIAEEELNNLKAQSYRLDIAKKVRDLETPSGGLTGGDRFDAETKLADKFDARTGDYKSARTQIANIRTSFDSALRRAAAGESINAASQGVLVSFQKLLDPTSVVRESEYARSPEGLSYIARLEGAATRIRQGGAGLTASDLKEFKDTAEEFLTNYEDAAISEAQLVITQANNYGLNVENIVPETVLDLMESRFEEGINNAQIGDTFEVGGRVFRKEGENEFIEI